MEGGGGVDDVKLREGQKMGSGGNFYNFIWYHFNGDQAWTKGLISGSGENFADFVTCEW